MANNNIEPGQSYSDSVVVSDSNIAMALNSGGLAVFSTPSMIALMECAAYKCIQDSLDSGQTSVGITVNIEHLAASPVGANITATATVESVDGRKVSFNVSATDGAGEIGRGTHTRAIVDIGRFMSKLQVRA